MEEIIKEAIRESWSDYQDASIGMDENEQWAHEHGWKDGAKWMLTELAIISKELLKKYMNILN